jgi:hypothetical protein
MPFGDSLAILAILAIIIICGIAVIAVTARMVIKRRFSLIGVIVGFVALLPLAALIRQSIIVGDIEYNPTKISLETISGIYVNGDRYIRLNSDGTYTSANVDRISSGDWSNNDWNLTFSNSSLLKPRLVTRNGTPCILPFYSGVDDPDGLLLTKTIKANKSEMATPRKPSDQF